MTRRLVKAAGTLAVLAVFLYPMAPVVAALVCAPWKQLTHQLQKRHGELLVAQGIDVNGILYSVLAAPTGGWSILATRPSDRTTCIMAIGKEDSTWHIIAPTSIKKDGPSSH
jgi:hypothetical protein